MSRLPVHRILLQASRLDQELVKIAARAPTALPAELPTLTNTPRTGVSEAEPLATLLSQSSSMRVMPEVCSLHHLNGPYRFLKNQQTSSTRMEPRLRPKGSRVPLPAPLLRLHPPQHPNRPPTSSSMLMQRPMLPPSRAISKVRGNHLLFLLHPG